MAARRLMNLCKHCREELQRQRPSELLSMLRVVSAKIYYLQKKNIICITLSFIRVLNI
jgi:hypothetical protein